MDKRNIEDICQLSAMQEMILFHCLYAPGSGVYISQITCRLQKLNIVAFKGAWQQVMDRHPILRTAFIWKGLKKPLQVVGRHVGAPLHTKDWRRLSLLEQQEQLDAFLRADRRQGFVLSRAPLMRLALLQTTDESYQLVWTSHHVLLDGWSTQLVFGELLSFYEGFCLGRSVRLEVRRPYRDYIAWLQKQDLGAAQTYWRETLSGFTSPTSLEIGRHAQVSPAGERPRDEHHIKLAAATTMALKKFAGRHHLTINTLAQGAWAMLLSRHSRANDVVFGIVVSGRPADLAGVESIVGLFINTLPVRVRVSPEDSLLAWLEKLQQQQVEMRQYEYTPLLQIQEWSDLPPGQTFFETVMAVQNYPHEALGGKEVDLQIEGFRGLESANYPFGVRLEMSSEWVIRSIYDPRRFDLGTVIRILEEFQWMLEQIPTCPQGLLKDIPFLKHRETEIVEDFEDELAEFDFQL